MLTQSYYYASGKPLGKNFYPTHLWKFDYKISVLFVQMMSELGLESESVSPPVGELVEHVWREAMGELESIISVPVTSVKSEQVG